MKRIILLLILLTFCISNASALTYDNLPNPTDLGYSPSDDTILFAGTHEDEYGIYKLSTDSGSYSAEIIGIPSPVSEVTTIDGRIYFYTGGSLYRTDGTGILLNFSYEFHDSHFQRLTGTSMDRFAHTPDGTIYGFLHSHRDTNPFYEITSPTFSSQELFSMKGLRDISPHPNGIVFSTIVNDYQDSATGHIYLFNGTDYYAVDSRSEYSSTLWANAGFWYVVSDISGNLYSFTRESTHAKDYVEPNEADLQFHEYNSSTGTYDDREKLSTYPFPSDMMISDLIYISYGTTIESIATEYGGGYTGEPIPPTTGNVSWDVGEAGTYTAGDVATINYTIQNMDSSKDYTLEVWTSSTMKQSYTLSDSSGTVTYDFPLDAIPTAYAAFLYEGDTKLDGQHCYLENPNYDYSISFSKNNYEVGEWVVINYEGLTPDMELILLADQETPDPDVLDTWTKSGDGQVSYKLSDDYAEDGIDVILRIDNENIDQDYADVITADTNLLYGTVYDASTGQRISGASVTVNSQVSITTQDGNYQLELPEGYYEATVSEGGYLVSKQDVLVQGPTRKNFYLTPETADTDVYGVVRDKDTNDPINDVVIYVDGNSFGEAVFTSSSGYFSLDGLTAGEEYDISATVSGYESYQSSFTATNNSTDLSFFMYPAGTGGDTDDPTGDDFSIDWESPDDAKSFAQEWTGITWFVLVVLFVIAAMGVKK